MIDLLSSLGLQSLFLFMTTVMVVNATPGADLLLTFTHTMRGGVRAGLAASAGIGTGALVHTALVVLGVSALIASHPMAFKMLQWAGAAYLAVLAIGLIRDGLREPVGQTLSDEQIAVEMAATLSPSSNAAALPIANTTPPTPAAPVPREGLWGAYTQGLTTNVLNPKVALFFLALLPQFVAPNAQRPGLAMLALGVWFAVQSTVFLALFVRLVARLRRWQPTPARRRALHMVAAAALLLVALRLVLTGLPS